MSITCSYPVQPSDPLAGSPKTPKLLAEHHFWCWRWAASWALLAMLGLTTAGTFSWRVSRAGSSSSATFPCTAVDPASPRRHVGRSAVCAWRCPCRGWLAPRCCSLLLSGGLSMPRAHSSGRHRNGLALNFHTTTLYWLSTAKAQSHEFVPSPGEGDLSVL